VRGNVLREEYSDLRRRIDATNVEQKSVCFNYIKSTYGPVKEGYALASSRPGTNFERGSGSLPPAMERW
jgi:hypothetical protein